MNKGFEDCLPSRSHNAVSMLLALALLAMISPRGQAAPPQQSAGQRPIVVQAGAFRGPTASAVLAVALEEKGFEPIVIPGDDYYRVVLGPFANDTEANAAIAKLKAEGYDSYLRRDLVLPAQTAVASRRTEAPTRQPPPRPASPAPVAPSPAQPAPRPAQAAPAPAPAEPQTQPSPPAVPPTRTLPLTRATPPRPTTPPATTPPQAEPAPPAATEPPVTVTQTAAQPAPVPRPGIPARPTEPQTPEPQTPEPAVTPPTVAQAEPAAAPQTPAPRAEARVSGPATVSAPVSVPQAGAPPTVGQARGASSLKILVMEGQGAINNIKQRTTRDPVIQVVDENNRPVAGVAVTFALPSRGASGAFANGARSMTVLTDSQGMATATGLTPNSVAGDLSIQVSASHQGQTASTLIAQTNVAAGAGMSAATIGIIGAIAAGAAVGAVMAFGGGDDPPVVNQPPVTPTTPTGTATVRPGGVTIGAP